MRRPRSLLVLVVAVAACRSPDTTTGSAVPDSGPAAPRLISVGPRLLSNQTTQPLTVVGDRLPGDATLHFGPPLNLDLPLTVIDPKHAYGRLPAGSDLGTDSERLVQVTLKGGTGRVELRLIADTAFPDATAWALTPDGKTAAIVDGPQDVVFFIDLVKKETHPVQLADGPSAIATWADGKTEPKFVVVHQFSNELRVHNRLGAVVSVFPGPTNASGVVVDARGIAYVAEQARDTVSAIDLNDEAKQLWRTSVAPNPRELLLTSKGLFVGSLQTGEVELLDPKTGAVLKSLQPAPGTSIVGGHTAPYGKFVMNGKAPRALAWSEKLGRLLVASIGPNIGPNPDKMEVSMNGGVAAVDPGKGWLRHLGFGAGVTEGLAVDDARGLLYAADQALGLVRVVDLKKLSESDAAAAKAVLQEVALPPPATFPHVRPLAEYGVSNRAGVSLHSGTRALWLSKDGKTLWVLNRFTGTVATLDVAKAPAGKAEWKEQFAFTNTIGQQLTRRLGQVLYFADMGRTAMSCDACHLEGHTEGVLFEKTTPLRIYRSPTVRGSRETPPFFTPASTHSMGETMKLVGGRNRYHNPDPSPEEIEALTVYGSLIPLLPNPFVGSDGAPNESVQLPDGQIGNARAGLALFETKAECSTCHPAPLFTTDQDPVTRGRFIDVGTPHFMPLREGLQNTVFHGFGTPSLAGAWDIFPMLTTGLAGLEVRADESVGVATRFPLRVAVERWAPKHGRADQLTPQERNDLLAYVMSL